MALHFQYCKEDAGEESLKVNVSIGPKFGFGLVSKSSSPYFRCLAIFLHQPCEFNH